MLGFFDLNFASDLDYPNMTEMTDKDFMEQALAEARQALDAGEFPVGCVIADGRRVLATGARTGSSGAQPNELDHAEMVALRKLYTAGGFERKTGPLTLYCSMEPCLMCFGAILLNGISRVVYAYEDIMGGGTACQLAGLPRLYAESGIYISGGLQREKSLALFQAFFRDPRQSYWRGSLLARYTLSQD